MEEIVRMYLILSLPFSLQLPHLATSYAAVNTLVTLGGDKAFSSINRYSFFLIVSFFSVRDN